MRGGGYTSHFQVPSTPVVLPLAGGHGNVCVLLVPGEETGECEGAVELHGSGQHIQLGPAGAHEGAGATDVDEQPLLEEVLGVVGQQGSLADKLNAPFDLKLWLSHGEAAAMKFGRHSCGEEENK